MRLPDPSRKPSITRDLWFVVQLGWNLGFIIAIPTVVFGFGGAYLDRWLGSSPAFLLLGLGLALTVSMVGVWKRIRQIVGPPS